MPNRNICQCEDCLAAEEESAQYPPALPVAPERTLPSGRPRPRMLVDAFADLPIINTSANGIDWQAIAPDRPVERPNLPPRISVGPVTVDCLVTTQLMAEATPEALEAETQARLMALAAPRVLDLIMQHGPIMVYAPTFEMWEEPGLDARHHRMTIRFGSVRVPTSGL